MTKEAALYSFWNGFDMAGYPSTSVPNDAEFPYLTYTPVTDSWGNPVAHTINIWDNTESEAKLNAKAREIAEVIGGGKYIPCDGGAVLLTRGSPFCQPLNDADNPAIKRRYINVTAQYLTLN